MPSDPPSELRLYLERLANGPLLDPVMNATDHCYLFAEDGSVLNGVEVEKRRKAIHQRNMNARPLVVRRGRKR